MSGLNSLINVIFEHPISRIQSSKYIKPLQDDTNKWKQFNLAICTKFQLEADSFLIKDSNGVEIDDDIFEFIELKGQTFHVVSKNSAALRPRTASTASTVSLHESDVELEGYTLHPEIEEASKTDLDCSSNSSTSAIDENASKQALNLAPKNDLLKEKMEIMDILQSTTNGRSTLFALEEMEEPKVVHESELRRIVKLVVLSMRDKHSPNGERISSTTKIAYARGLCEVFSYYKHSESQFYYELFYQPPHQKKNGEHVPASGMIETALKLVRHDFPDRKKKQNFIDSNDIGNFSLNPNSTPKKIKTTHEFNCSDNEISDLQSIFKNLPYTQENSKKLMTVFRQLFNHRNGVRHEDPSQLVKEYPKLFQQSVFILEDFKVMFEDSHENLVKYWEELKKAIVFFTRKIPYQSHQYLKDFVDFFDKEERPTGYKQDYNDDEMIFLCLLHLVPPLGGRPGSKNKGCSHSTGHRMAARKVFAELLIKHEKVGTPLQELLTRDNLPTQPYLLALSNSLNNPNQDYFLIIDGKAISVPGQSPVMAMDTLFKSFYVFSTEYDLRLKNFFQVLQLAVFKIGRKNCSDATSRTRKTFNDVINFVSSLK